MYIPERGVLKESNSYFCTPSNIAKSMFFYLLCAGHFYCNSNYLVQRDSYDSYMLMFIKSGSGTASFEGKAYSLSKNDILFLDCYKPHSYATKAGWETLWIHFDGNTSRDFFQLIFNRSGCVTNSGNSLVIQKYLQMILEYLEHSIKLSEPTISCHIQKLLTEILLLSTNNQYEAFNESNPITEAISYIEANYKENLNLNIIAHYVNMSVFYFSRVFKRETGYSPYEYIIKTRIDHAKILLRTTKLYIKEVAFESGFGNESNFINSFRINVGLTPGEFRNMSF